jgi:hypothetical protein
MGLFGDVQEDPQVWGDLVAARTLRTAGSDAIERQRGGLCDVPQQPLEDPIKIDSREEQIRLGSRGVCLI